MNMCVSDFLEKLGDLATLGSHSYVASVGCRPHHSQLQWDSNLSVSENHLLVETQIAGLYPRVYISVGPEWA